MWFPFFETGLEQPTGRFWQTDRRERTNMHHRVDAVTTASYPFAHQQTTHASKPHLNLCIPPVWAIGGRGGLSLLLYSPAQDGKHIKCFPLRAELATNSTRASRPRRPSRRDRKTFSKKLLRGGQTSVYTNPRSARERKQTRTTAWGVSSVWLERRPVTSEVAGSSPVLPANAIKATSSDVAFCV